MSTMGNAPAAVAAGAKVKLRSAYRGRVVAGYGMGEAERDVLDMFDEGIGQSEIARALRMSPGRVSRIIRTYAERPGEARAAYEASKQSCDLLLRAQIRSGQHSLPNAIAQALIVAMRIRPPEGHGA